ncbi:MAG: STM4011 family radical SAM protein [Byssovorax sp.]
MKLSILYRGPLESCNYACAYCPFAKKVDDRAALDRDQAALDRFVAWVANRRQDHLGILFTPWGEALVRPWYQEALATLSHLPNVDKAAIQTNLSCKLDWVARCDTRSLALWATFHPGEVPRARFVARCHEAARLGVRMSAGIVGLREHLDEMEALRRELPGDVYLWVNAFKRTPGYYTEAEVRRIEAVDALFRLNNTHHPSLGRSCAAGRSAISVSGDGTARRCHFIEEPIGNIYQAGWERALGERPCTNATCGCHIGYVHLDYLDLGAVFGAGILERAPDRKPRG